LARRQDDFLGQRRPVAHPPVLPVVARASVILACQTAEKNPAAGQHRVQRRGAQPPGDSRLATFVAEASLVSGPRKLAGQTVAALAAAAELADATPQRRERPEALAADVGRLPSAVEQDEQAALQLVRRLERLAQRVSRQLVPEPAQELQDALPKEVRLAWPRV
jgi:hypothetical protein